MKHFSKIIESWLTSLLLFVFSNKKINGKNTPYFKRILIVKYCCFGDSIISLSAIRSFHKKHPDVIIDVLCTNRVAEVYSSIPEINTVYILPVTGKHPLVELLNPLFWKQLLIILVSLRKQNYSELFDLELYRSSPLLFKLFCKIPRSRGFRVPGTSVKSHELLVLREKDQPEWECFYHLFGIEHLIKNPVVQIYPFSTSLNRAAQNHLGIVFGSSFNWPQKKWPLHYYAELINSLTIKGYKVFLFGSKYETNESQTLESMLKRPVENTTGKLSFSELVNTIQSCKLLIGNDTGTLHLASACGVPSITLFGPTNPKKWNSFLSTPIYVDIECRPCYYLSSMPDCAHFNCLKQLSPSVVLKKAMEQLNSEYKSIDGQ